ncbi:MAG: hypothetical protein U5R49_25515 [Deltaproteobacteria bacterium]|nr:hypothetical protein [Deltaproteobacteria bacterium]
MAEIRKILADMEPKEALSEIGAVLQDLFAGLDDETKMAFLYELFGESGTDKVSSMVHL